jgi:predicted nucleic acid-binding Zn ribbon protein
VSKSRRRRGGPDPGPQPLGQAMARVLGRLGVSPSATTMEVVFTRWDEVVGAELSAHVRPVRLQDSVLVVGVDHPTWATRARMESGRIIARVRELGDTTIERVEVVVQRP